MRPILILLALAAARAQSYNVVEFDPPGSTQTFATAINNAGQILGQFASATGTHCFLRGPDGTFTFFDPPGINVACAGLNNLGQAVGTFQDDNRLSHGYIRSAAGEFTIFDLMEPGRLSGPGAFASAINDRGEVVGTFASPPYGGPGFLRAPDGTFTDLQAFSIGQIVPVAINNRDEIAGWTLIGSSLGTQHGFLRSADGFYRKFDLPGTVTFTRIAALNNLGQFAGAMVGGSPGFVSNPDGSFTLLPGRNVTGLNDSNVITGYAFDGKTSHAFLGTPAAAPSTPAIRTELPGVQTAAAFGGARTIAPGTWIEIYGRNLAPTTRTWQSSDFDGGRTPTSLDGVRVTVGGVPAYVSYISPGQVNALVPSNVAAGNAEVTVTNGTSASAPYPVTVVASQPSMLMLPPDQASMSTYAAALFPDFTTYALPASPLYSAVPTRRAKAGDTLVFFGAGFGASELAGRVEFTFQRADPAAATVVYAGPAPGTVGLYQFNVVVPDIPLFPGETSSDYVSLKVTLDGVPLTASPGLILSYSK